MAFWNSFASDVWVSFVFSSSHVLFWCHLNDLAMR